VSAWGDLPRPEGHWVLIRPRAEVEAQARDALAAIEEANGGTLPPRLRDAYDIDRAAFASLIEALVQLGGDVDDEMQTLAGIRPIEESLG
jgi:hypothetical protein